MHRELKIAVSIDLVPESANLWRDVQRIQLGARRTYDVPYLKDLRVTRWEAYQSQRLIPVLYQGEVVETILVSSEVPIEVVQRRLDLWRTWRLLYTLMALDAYTWVIVRQPLPLLALECIEQCLRRRRLEQLQPERAGLRPGMADAMTQTSWTSNRSTQTVWTASSSSPTFWDDQQFIIVWIFMCHDPRPKPVPWVVNVMTTAGQLRNSLANHIKVSPEFLMMSTYDRPIGDMVYLHDLVSGPIIIHVDGEQGSHGSRCNYQIQWQHEDSPVVDSLDFVVDPPSPAEMNLHVVPPQPAPVVETVDSDGNVEMLMDEAPPQHPPQPRAGARNSRPNMQDHRTQMIAWAMDKISRRFPHYNQSTVLMLLKAESRTVTAMLNCRSDIQLADVICAAYRRAGLQPPSAQAASSAASTRRHQDEDGHQSDSASEGPPPPQQADLPEQMPWLPAIEALTSACAQSTAQCQAMAVNILVKLQENHVQTMGAINHLTSRIRQLEYSIPVQPHLVPPEPDQGTTPGVPEQEEYASASSSTSHSSTLIPTESVSPSVEVERQMVENVPSCLCDRCLPCQMSIQGVCCLRFP